MIKLFEKHKIVPLILTILIAVEIFYFSSIPGSLEVGKEISWLPVAYHFIVFFLFNFFLLTTIKGKKGLTAKMVLTSIIISVLYAILDEFHQTFTPLRNASITDILIDSAGILFSTFLSLIIYKNKKKLTNKNSSFIISFFPW